ncbi:MAG: hypothetical protein PHE26_08310 [Syntrophomonadaceae bacterium]|nr:hypothetical protein [Syntrophomonadaceae bacterium]
MSENSFTPLMAEFLRQLAGEVEKNKALARRLAAPFQSILQASLTGAGTAEKTARKAKSGTKQKQYPTPEGFDPYQVFYDEGSPGLFNALHKMEVDELKGVLGRFTDIPRKDFVRKQNQEILTEMAVQGVKEVAARGLAFGDYKLDI